MAHELGHDRLHKEIAMLKGFQESRVFDMMVSTEYEANLFVAELMIEDRELLNLFEYDDRSFSCIANELYVPGAILDFKLRILKHKGYSVEAPYWENGDFLKKHIDGCYEDDF